MVHVCSGITVQQKDAAVVVVLFHVAAEGGIAIHAVQNRRRIGVDLMQAAKFSGKICPYQRRRILRVVWELDLSNLFSCLLRSLSQNLDLGAFSASVQAFYNNQFALHHRVIPLMFFGGKLFFQSLPA